MLSIDELLDIILANEMKMHLVKYFFSAVSNIPQFGDVDVSTEDMRKALSRDVEKKSLIPIPHPVRPEDLVDD
jgi:hypothetical protein